MTHFLCLGIITTFIKILKQSLLRSFKYLLTTCSILEKYNEWLWKKRFKHWFWAKKCPIHSVLGIGTTFLVAAKLSLPFISKVSEKFNEQTLKMFKKCWFLVRKFPIYPFLSIIKDILWRHFSTLMIPVLVI